MSSRLLSLHFSLFQMGLLRIRLQFRQMPQAHQFLLLGRQDQVRLAGLKCFHPTLSFYQNIPCSSKLRFSRFNDMSIVTIGTATPEFHPKTNLSESNSNNFPEFIPRSYDVDSLVSKI